MVARIHKIAFLQLGQELEARACAAGDAGEQSAAPSTPSVRTRLASAKPQHRLIDRVQHAHRRSVSFSCILLAQQQRATAPA